MSEKEKRGKISIVQTRKVIANKFKKLNRDRVIREKDLHAKYAPITDSINRLIETKENVSKENHRLYEPDDYSMSSSIVLPNIKNENDLMYFEENANQIGNNDPLENVNYGLNEISERIEQKPLAIKKEVASMPRMFFNSFGDAAKYKENTRNQATVLAKIRKRATAVRKCKRTEANDAKRSMNEKRKYAGNRKRIIDSIDIASKTKTKTKPRNVNAIRKSEQKSKRLEKHDALRQLGASNKLRKKRAHEIVSPDYDADGHYLGPAQKRRKVERKRKEKLVVLSPEDYGIDGSSVGVANKRRKIEISSDNVSKVTKNVAKKLQKKAADMRRNKRIAAMKKIKYGTCLEKKFIPYVENIVYEYYDNPNELCDRLKLLISSKGAGNSNHNQEINSIVEELRERHLIH